MVSIHRRSPDSGAALADVPHPVAPCAWVLPDPAQADADGVVGIGADLQPSTLVEAYGHGIFPWPHTGTVLPWFSPDPRGVLELDGVHVARSLRTTFRRSGWTTTVDRTFVEVVNGCATARGPDGTWITGAMAQAYQRLHALGWAHSVEVWDGTHLVGGLYGVQIGGVFTGESMFHRATDASKAAMVDLAGRFREAGGQLFDVQLTTGHLRSMGARDLPRATFLRTLRAVGDHPVRLPVERRPVTWLLAQR